MATRFKVKKFDGKNLYVLFGNTIQGGPVLSSTPWARHGSSSG